MKLIKFALNGYRGITGGLEQNSINFDSSSAIFIFGQNNVGKSTFLRGYVAFYENSVIPDDFTHGAESDITVEVELRIDETKDKPVIDEGTGGKFDNLKAKYLDDKGNLKLRKTWKFEDKGKKPLDETLNVTSGQWEAKAYGGIGIHTVFQALLMKPLFIQAMPTEKQVEDIVNEVLKEAASKRLSDEESDEYKAALDTISKLQDKAYSKASIDNYKTKVNEQFQKLFSSYRIGIDDGVSKVKYTHDKLGKDFKIDFQRVDDGHPSSYVQMGHGAVRMAIFLLMLLRDELKGESMDKSFLVLFEEPELFLHPSLTKKLRGLIYEVTDDNTPFQVLCASHSPQMIDISKDHSSLVRMTKDNEGATRLYQVEKQDLQNDAQPTKEDVKQKIYEILRLDPFVCESFYADEVILVEGETESIISRGYEQELGFGKDIFVVNCHSCVNIPFYQKLFSKFNIRYNVICDTDHFLPAKDESGTNRNGWNGQTQSPTFTSGIQKTIQDQFDADKAADKAGYFLVFPMTFEPHHAALEEPFKFDDSGSEGKPFNANRYWQKIAPHSAEEAFGNVPIIDYLHLITGQAPETTEAGE